MKHIALIACPGVSLPAPLAVIAELLSRAIQRSFGQGAASVTPVSASASAEIATAVERADRTVVLLERAEQLDVMPAASRRQGDILLAGLQGPPRRPGPLLPAQSARLRLDHEPRLTPDREVAPCLDDLSPSAQQSLARLARAALDRRVGVALGAGGAWGYAHVRLLMDLLDQGVPIDAVAGSSFGAVVGAYFCARGRAGLTQMIEESDAIGKAARRAFLSMDTIEKYLDRSLSSARLEELEIPLLPVAFNIDGGDFHVATEGKVSRAVRQSGSFPGLFGPTVEGGGRVVDGCVRALVPDAMFGEGFGLVIASNVVPPPAPRAPREPAKGRIGAWLHAVDPVARAVDLVRSAQYWLHASGETGPAHVRFRLDRAEALLWSFDQVGEVMRRSEASSRRCAAQAREKWEALQCV